MKVSLPEWCPAAVTEAPAGRGGAWTLPAPLSLLPDLIVSGLSRVSAEGGTAEPITLVDESRGETSHWWPVALPDGIHFLYFVRSVNDDHRGIYIGRLDRPAARTGERLFFSDSGAAYVPIAGSDEADLIYVANGRVESRRFNNVSLTVDAHARTLDFLPAKVTVTNPLLVGASNDVMAFAETIIPAAMQLASVNLDGKDLRLWERAPAHNWPRVSPDGRLLARPHIDASLSQPDIWVEDLERGTVYPVLKTLEPDISPTWSPDGRQLAFVTGHLPHQLGETDPQHRCSRWNRHRSLAEVPWRLLRADPTGVRTDRRSSSRPGNRATQTSGSFRRIPRVVPSRYCPQSSTRWMRGTLPMDDGSLMCRRNRASRKSGSHRFGPAAADGRFRGGRNAACVAAATEIYCISWTWRAGCEVSQCTGRRMEIPLLAFRASPTCRNRIRALGDAVRRLARRQPRLLHAAHGRAPPREIQVAINWRTLLD